MTPREIARIQRIENWQDRLEQLASEIEKDKGLSFLAPHLDSITMELTAERQLISSSGPCFEWRHGKKN